ncbi:MAG TPA: adenylate/guanylate cyclase domain-containing protein [Roseiarcus sp.]|nr:adenylate/guanylate cyclase domain-containing protein [Roseiarcus sp.]
MRRAHEARLYALTTATACGLALLAGVVGAPARAVMQNLVFDQYQRWKPRPYAFDQPVRIVAVDDESLKRLGQWPWPRERLAALVDALKRAGVASISFDFLFAEKDRGDATAAADNTPDAIFARSMDDGAVVLGSFVTELPTSATSTAKAGFVTAGDDAAKFLAPWPGLLSPVPELAQHAAGIGFLNWRPDADRVVRRVPLILNVNGALQPSLAMEALRTAQGASTYIVKSSNASGETAFGQVYGVLAIRNGDLTIPTDATGDIRVYFARADPRRSIPAWKALEPGADLSDLRGAIVFFGASAALLSDIVATPLSPAMPGVEAHAQIVEQLLSGQTLRRPDWAPSAEWMATALICAALVVTTWILGPYLAALAYGAVLAGIVAVSWFAFSRHGILIEPTYPAFSAAAVYFAGVSTLYAVKRHQEREIRSAFGRFVSPAVVSRLAEMPGALELGGLQRELTLLFCDIRSFTTISEGLNASELTHFLNQYLTPMTDAILDREGTIDKYMGDAIMAFWNAPLDDPDHAAHAVESALEMRETLVALNESWRSRAEAEERPFKPVRFGIGLNSGECCVGNLGSLRRFDYSAIGDEVNVASRLEGACKIFEVDIIGSETVRSEAPDFAWLEIDSVLVKGKTRPVGLYALAGDSGLAASDEFAGLSHLHAAMLAAYRNRDFAGAISMAKEASARAPIAVRGLYNYNLRRFTQLADSAQDPDWRPLIALDEK